MPNERVADPLDRIARGDCPENGVVIKDRKVRHAAGDDTLALVDDRSTIRRERAPLQP